MKKVILTISIIAIVVIAAVSMVACNSATPQGQLQNLLNDHNHEAFEYTLYAKDSSGNKIDGYSGTYSVKLDAYAQGSKDVPWYNGSLENVQKGVLVSGELNAVQNGSTVVYKTGCYFNIISGSSYMVPAYTYRVQTVDDKEQFVLNGEYDGNNLNYTRIVNGVTSTGKVECKATTLFDNNEFHQSLRTLTTFSDSMSFSFTTPIVSMTEATTVTLTASISSTSKIKNAYTSSNSIEDGIECYKTYISRSTEVAGVAQTLYYAKSDIQYQGWNIKNVLMQIEEPFKLGDDICTMVYELTSATLA